MNLVTNGRLITRDAGGKGYYEHGAVAYEGAKIVEVGEEAALRAKYADAEIVDAKGGVIMPALINAHTHNQHRSIQEPDRHSVPHPISKHTDTSQQIRTTNPLHYLKKAQGVCRGGAALRPLCGFQSFQT